MKKFFSVLLKILKWLLIIIVSLVLILMIVRFIGKTINKKTPNGGINEEMYVDVNGQKQWISIYGNNKDNPVMLYLRKNMDKRSQRHGDHTRCDERRPRCYG